MRKEQVEPLPHINSLKEIAKNYIKELNERPRYAKEGEALNWLFKTFPENSDINEVLVKVMALDSSYSTSLRRNSSILEIANKITNIPYFSDRVISRDLSLVDEICFTGQSYSVDEERIGKQFSFASKYCCLQNLSYKENPNNDNNQYAIFDSFVAKVITYYQEKYNFLGCKEKISLGILTKSYENSYFPIINKFKESLNFAQDSNISFRDLDHFLWRMGQEFFLGYQIAKIGDFVIMLDVKNFVKIFEKDNNINLENDVIPTLKRKKRYFVRKVNEKDCDLALRILKEFYVCVNRKEGIVGDYYIDVSKKKVNLYRLCNTQNKKGSHIIEKLKKLVKEKYGELNISVNDLLKLCEGIVEKYYEELENKIKKDAEGNITTENQQKNESDVRISKLIGDYVVKIRKNGQVSVYHPTNEIKPITKGIKEVAKLLEGFVWDDKWNTQQAGAKIIKYATEHPDKIINNK